MAELGHIESQGGTSVLPVHSHTVLVSCRYAQGRLYLLCCALILRGEGVYFLASITQVQAEVSAGEKRFTGWYILERDMYSVLRGGSAD